MAGFARTPRNTGHGQRWLSSSSRAPRQRPVRFRTGGRRGNGRRVRAAAVRRGRSPTSGSAFTAPASTGSAAAAAPARAAVEGARRSAVRQQDDADVPGYLARQAGRHPRTHRPDGEHDRSARSRRRSTGSRTDPGPLPTRSTRTLTTPAPTSIAIVDDVLTTGAHIRAATAVLAARLPTAAIVGLFIARRAPGTV